MKSAKKEMKIRQMNKILKTERPPETNRHVSAYQYRYNRAWIYFNKISRKRLRKRRKEGNLMVWG